MNSRVAASSLVAVVLVVVGFFLAQKLSGDTTFRALTADTAATPTLTIDGTALSVELAITQGQQSQGLSGRSSLAQNAGMLFPFSPPSQPSFWMKDMNFPLDFVWIYQNKIVDITRNVPNPDPATPVTQLPMYTPSGVIDNVLEINAGAAANFHIGDSVTFANISGI